MSDATPVLGVLAGLVGIANAVPYVRDMIRGRTRPHRGTWLIWAVLAIVAFVSQRAAGASWSVVMTGTQAILTTTVFLLAIRHGEGGMTAGDLSLIALAGAGVVGWLLARTPVVALACVIAADLIAIAMMTPKAYRDPRSETLSMYVLASVGGALAAGAAGSAEASLLLYPGYYCLANAAVAILLHRRRAVLDRAPAAAPAKDASGSRTLRRPRRRSVRRHPTLADRSVR